MRDNIVSSSYWFLANSNCSNFNPSPANQQKIKNFLEGIKRIFLSRNILNFIDIISEEDKNIPKQDLILEIRSELIEEVGEQNGMVHFHISVTIYHRTTLKLNVNRMAKFFIKMYNQVVYFSPPRIIPDNSVSIKRYQFKTVKRFPKLKINSTLVDIDNKSQNYFYAY